MERPIGFMSALSDLEFLILDELYFISSYNTVLQNVGYDEEIFRSALISLLEKGWISQMKYDSGRNDFERFDEADSTSISKSYFVATKQGLLIHNSRN